MASTIKHDPVVNSHTDTMNEHRAPWRDKWGEIIFGNQTVAGRVFDVILLVLIVLSVLTVLLETVQSIDNDYRASFLCVFPRGN